MQRRFAFCYCRSVRQQRLLLPLGSPAAFVTAARFASSVLVRGSLQQSACGSPMQRQLVSGSSRKKYKIITSLFYSRMV